MAKATLNSGLKGLHGELDWVYRKTSSCQVVARLPAPTKAAPTATQLAAQEQFRAAAAYAKAAIVDAVLGPRYAAAAKAAGRQPYVFAFADFFHPPQVWAIDASGYHGAIGEAIKVQASSGFEVTGVTVILRNAAEAVLEQGAAAFVDGVWRYAAKTAVATGTSITVQAVAADRPGHTGSRTLALVVA